MGAIVLARHGEPALSRKVKLDAPGYDRWWATYEAGGILPSQAPPADLLAYGRRASVVLASTRRRALESAMALETGKPITQDAMFVEAPLPAPALPRFARFSPKVWGVLSRLWWWLGAHGDRETRQEAQARAVHAAERLIALAESGEEVLVLAHGFFNGMVGIELRKRGWRCVKDRGFAYWAARRFERA